MTLRQLAQQSELNDFTKQLESKLNTDNDLPLISFVGIGDVMSCDFDTSGMWKSSKRCTNDYRFEFACRLYFSNCWLDGISKKQK